MSGTSDMDPYVLYMPFMPLALAVSKVMRLLHGV